MRRTPKSKVIQNLLGSARLFASAVHELAQDVATHETEGDHLTLARLDVLELVAHCPNSTVSHVAAFLGTSNAAASKLVDKLVRYGYLARFEREGDRRSHLLRLTPPGARALSQFATAQAQAIAPLLAPIDNSRLEVTAQLLDEVAAMLVGGEQVSSRCLRCGAYIRGNCGPRLGHPERCLSGAAAQIANNGHHRRSSSRRRRSAA